MKKCNFCKEIKDKKDFYKDRRGFSDGLKTSCKDCDKLKNIKYKNDNKLKILQKSKIRYAENPMKDREKHLKKKYNMTEKCYQEMLLNQQNSCAICKNKPKRLVVDHCHKTGKVRGLLCINCNFGLGYFKDNQENLEKAAQFVKAVMEYPLLTTP